MTREYAKNREEYFREFHSVVAPVVVVDGYDYERKYDEEIRGEIDIYEPMHWHQMQMMFQRNARRTRMEQNATKPSDAINSALDNFWEVQDWSNDSTEQEKMLSHLLLFLLDSIGSR